MLLAKTQPPYPRRLKPIPLSCGEALFMEETTTTAKSNSPVKKQRFVFLAVLRRDTVSAGIAFIAISIARIMSPQFALDAGKQPMFAMAAAL